MTRTIGVGIVGLSVGQGWAARAHVPALRSLADYQITALSASSLKSAEASAREHGVPHAFPDAASLARDGDVDLVSVTVKVPHHRELVAAAIGAGKSVYCEWPLGNGLAEARAMRDDARAAGLETHVGLQARSSPTVRYLRDLIREGFVGTVLSTTLVGSGGVAGPETEERDAYINDAKNGATLLTIPFGHTVDGLRFCLGEFRSLSARTARRRTTYRVTETGEERPMLADDQILVNGQLESGATVAIHYRGGSSRATNLRWEINGTDGDLEVTAASGHLQIAALTLRGARGDDRVLKELAIPQKYRLSRADLPQPAVNVAEAYLQIALGADAPFPVPDFSEAVRMHELLDAIERSAASGTTVEF